MERLDRWLSICANVGVLAGIVFLAYEIQVNTDAVQSSTYASWNEASQSWGDFAAENAKALAAIQDKELDELTPEEFWIVAGFATKSFNQGQAAFLHNRAGSLPDAVMAAHIRGLVETLERAVILRGIWREGAMRDMFAPSFVEYLEGQVAGLAPDHP